VTLKGQGHDFNIFKARYFEKARDRDSVTMGHLEEMVCTVSNSHVNNDVT